MNVANTEKHSATIRFDDIVKRQTEELTAHTSANKIVGVNVQLRGDRSF